jgi:hypothetical protein
MLASRSEKVGAPPNTMASTGADVIGAWTASSVEINTASATGIFLFGSS